MVASVNAQGGYMLAADGVRGGRRGCWLEIAPETGTTAWAVRCGWDREGIAWLGCASPSINQEFVPSMAGRVR